MDDHYHTISFLASGLGLELGAFAPKFTDYTPSE